MDIITGKILKLNQWPDGRIIGIAKKIAAQLGQQGFDRETILARLDDVRQNPSPFLTDELMADLARECIRLTQAELPSHDLPRESPLAYPIWGKENIEAGSIAQMDNAMRLPVSVAGALMPDAHVGYGLPIGGVLATENAVIPYAVGVDIACRMRLSLYEVSPDLLGQKPGLFEQALIRQTAFGMGAQWKGRDRAEHEVLDDQRRRVDAEQRGSQQRQYHEIGDQPDQQAVDQPGYLRYPVVRRQARDPPHPDGEERAERRGHEQVDEQAQQYRYCDVPGLRDGRWPEHEAGDRLELQPEILVQGARQQRGDDGHCGATTQPGERARRHETIRMSRGDPSRDEPSIGWH